MSAECKWSVSMGMDWLGLAWIGSRPLSPACIATDGTDGSDDEATALMLVMVVMALHITTISAIVDQKHFNQINGNKNN